MLAQRGLLTVHKSENPLGEAGLSNGEAEGVGDRTLHEWVYGGQQRFNS
jgi:hypothetical protein